MRLVFARSVAAWSVAVSVLQPVEQPSELVQRIRGSAQFAEASAFIDGDYDRFVNELVALTEIPAPPFKEQARAKAYLEMLRRQGLSDVEIDAEGNVMGVRKGTGRRLDGGRARSPRHRVSGRHRRQGQAAGHAAHGARHRRQHARPGVDARGHPRDAGRQISDDERHAVCRQRRRGRRRRPARRQVPASAGQVQGSDQAVHRDRRRRSGQHHEWRRRQQALSRDVQGARRPQLRRVRPRQPGLRDGERDREVLAHARAGRAEDDVQRRRRLAGERRSTRFHPRSAWTSTCDRSRARS